MILSLALHDCSYGYRRNDLVLDRLSLRFPAGITLLLGPNGAGKSTLLGISASALSPSRGSVNYNGLDPAVRRDRAAFRQAVAWMPQQINPIPGLTVQEQVTYMGWLKGLTREDARRKSANALEAVDLTPLAGRRSHELSGGQLRRMGLAQALVHAAQVVLMDEPTAGLDPTQRETFRELVRRISVNTQVVISTHQIEDINELYESVIVLDRGQVRFHGTTNEFLRADDAVSAYRRLVSGDV
ncbi:ATP-binding cassette domain-containing protein [Sphaerisporangium sp. NPDC051011]|uniref:ATP-binding cassette domain-containing protein n=1 Tax=Sphaerisporangium sp. NPDC051011 TaxID=3155792 RepID=UPI00340B8D7D